MRWKHILWDLFAVVFFIVTALAWKDRPEYKQVLDIVMCLGILIFRIDAHRELYRKEKRFY